MASKSSSEETTPPKKTFKVPYNKALFGEAKEMSDEYLPTHGDILLHYLFLNEKQNISFKEVTPYVTDKIIEIWHNFPLPILQRKSIHKKLGRFLDQHHGVIKNKHMQPHLLADFRVLLGTLFWVSKCTCDLLTSNCTCYNVPLFMKSFIVDQLTHRRMTISQFVETIPQPTISTEMQTQGLSSDDTWEPSIPTGAASMDYEEEGEPAARGPYTQNVTLSNFAIKCDRYGVSHRAAAALASGLMKDLNIKDKNDQMLIVDKNKVQRERNRCRNEALKKRLDTSTLLAFAFDSRKDETLVSEMIHNKLHTRKIKEPHMVVVREPNSTYLGYIISTEETAEAKCHQLIDFFGKNDISLDSLVAILSNGEPVNTGVRGGIIRLFEQHLKRSLHWCVCLLHFNELPLRHLYDALEKSVTTGPGTSTGQLSALLANCDTIQVRYKYFEKIIYLNYCIITFSLFYRLSKTFR